MYTIIPISLLWYDWNNIYTIWSLQCSLKTPSSCSSHLADQGWVGKVANFSGFILEQMVITWCYTFHRGPGTLREAIRPPVVFHFWDISYLWLDIWHLGANPSDPFLLECICFCCYYHLPGNSLTYKTPSPANVLWVSDEIIMTMRLK